MRPDAYRWVAIALVFFATFINFIDRLTVSVLAPVIRENFGLSNLEYATISTWFLVAYTASHGLSGRLYDRIGTKRGFSLSVIVWSLAAMAHAFAGSARALSVCRFVLGLGEAGNWPGAAKVIAAWFPAHERAFAMGIFNSGVALGNIVALPLIVWLQTKFGWQATFLFTGSLGFLWLAAWLAFYRERPAPAPQAHERSTGLFRDRRIWGIVLARLFTDPAWWLYLTWMPLYLANARGLTLSQIAAFAWLPYVAADAGSLGGGALAGWLIARGWAVANARRAVILLGAACMACSAFIATAPTAGAALAWIAVVMFGFQAWVNNVQTLPSDLYPESRVGAIAGLGGTAAGVGSIISTLSIGWVVDRFSYTPVLVAAAVIPLIGTSLLLALTFASPHEEATG